MNLGKWGKSLAAVPYEPSWRGRAVGFDSTLRQKGIKKRKNCKNWDKGKKEEGRVERKRELEGEKRK